MSKLPKIGHDVAADNYVLSEDIGRMAGKTIKTVRLWHTRKQDNTAWNRSIAH